jgi:hypothetical protein
LAQAILFAEGGVGTMVVILTANCALNMVVADPRDAGTSGGGDVACEQHLPLVR